MNPLVAAENLRIDVGGSMAIEKATFEIPGDSAVIAGDGHALLAAIAGQAEIRSGTLLLLGRPADGARARGDVGLAPFDPPLPSTWTVGDYLSKSARLCAAGAGDARRRASAVLGELDVRYLHGAKIADLSLHERRATVIAHAIVTEPALLVASTPLAGLAGEPAAYVAQVLRAATRGRKWIASVASLHAGSPDHLLAAQAQQLVVFSSGRLVHRGAPSAPGGSVGYTITVRGRVDELRAALRARGVELSGGPARFWIELPAPMAPADLLAISLQTGAPIVELCPRVLFAAPNDPGVTPREAPR